MGITPASDAAVTSMSLPPSAPTVLPPTESLPAPAIITGVRLIFVGWCPHTVILSDSEGSGHGRIRGLDAAGSFSCAAQMLHFVQHDKSGLFPHKT